MARCVKDGTFLDESNSVVLANDLGRRPGNRQESQVPIETIVMRLLSFIKQEARVQDRVV